MATSSSNRKVVAVFGGGAPQPGSPAYIEAQRLGRLLAQAGYNVLNGGYSGTMEAVSRGAIEAGGHVIAVTSRVFSVPVNGWFHEEVCTTDLFELRHFQFVDDPVAACEALRQAIHS